MLEKNNKLSYSIGQVAKHADLPQSVLRYWETVFPLLNPVKSSGGSRQYSDYDISIILRIKELLYENGFTIKGANIQLNKEYAQAESKPEAKLAEDESIEIENKSIESVSKNQTNTQENTKKLISELKKIIAILED